MKLKNRIEVADALRGFSLFGIIIIHCLLSFNNYYETPKSGNSLIQALNSTIDYLSLLYIAGKAQNIFAILFGFSFFIQYNNQLEKGNDFGLRYMWRLCILFVIGIINGAFFVGEILVQFSILGMLLPFIIKLKTKTLTVIAITILLFPSLPLFFSILKNINPDIPYISVRSITHSIVSITIKNGNFIETINSNVLYGNINTLINLAWAISFKLIAMFIVGIIIGRKKLLIYTQENKKYWMKSLVIFSILSLITYFFMAYTTFFGKQGVDYSLHSVASYYFNITFTFCIINVFLLSYYTNIGQKILSKFSTCGKMSLTVYVSQSVIGSFLFYNWGLNLAGKLLPIQSLLLAIAIFLIQTVLCRLWLQKYRQGPVEYAWKKLTWIDFSSLRKVPNQI